MFKRFIVIGLLCLLGVAAPVTAEDAVSAIARSAAEAAFGEAERRVIEGYLEQRRQMHGRHQGDDYRDYEGDRYDEDRGRDRGRHPGGKDKGKPGKGGKSKGLPPGIAMKLERGGELPPGIERTRLPRELEDDLPPAPRGYERTLIGNQVLLVDKDTGMIADIVGGGSRGGERERVHTRQTEQHMDRARETRRDRGDAAGSAAGGAQAPKSKRWWEIWK